ncbi:transposase [Streptococcus sp. 517s]
MAQKAHSLSHTKWMCKYHIVFTPKYRRKIIYNQYRSSLGEIFHRLCSYRSALMMFDKHANLKYKFGNRHFWHDIALDKLSVKEYEDLFRDSGK